jgi:hypothetical protein
MTYQEQAEKRMEIARENKEKVCEFMKEKNIDSATLTFDGSGDSGQIEDISLVSNEFDQALMLKTNIAVRLIDSEYYNSTAKQWEHVDKLVEKPFGYCLEEWAYTLLSSRFGGWEINEGSYGEIVLNKDGTGRVEFNERIETVETSNVDF